MLPCLSSHKTVHILSRIIFNAFKRRTVNNYQTVRMSDLRDELYSESPYDGPKRSQSNSQNEVQDNQIQLNEKGEMKNTKKRIIKINIKISDDKARQDGRTGEENDDVGLREATNGNYCNVEQFDGKSVKKIERFKTTTSNTTYMIELSKESTNKHYKVDYNDNSLIDKQQESVENVLETDGSKNYNNYKIIDSNVKESCNKEHKTEDKEVNDTEKLTTLPPIVRNRNAIINKQEKENINIAAVTQSRRKTSDNQKNEVNSKIEDEVQKNDKYVYESFNTKVRDDNSNYIKENMYKENCNLTIQYIKKANIENSVYALSKSLIGTKSDKQEDCTKSPVTNFGKLKENIYENAEKISIERNSEVNNKTIINDSTNCVFEKRYNYSYSNIQQNNYTNNANIQKNVSNERNTKDSIIIKDLVIKRFEDVMNQFKQKSLRRKQTRKCQSLCNYKEKIKSRRALERPRSLDVKNISWKTGLSQSDTKTPDSGLDATIDYIDCKSNESLKTCDETLKYSPTTFLRQALGDEYMNAASDSQQEIARNRRSSTPLQARNKQYNTERSIGSSDISTLISTIDSLYSTVDKNRKKRSSVLKKAAVVRPLFSSHVSSKTCVYESIEELKINPRSEELKNEIFVQSAIIVQVSKALDFCRQSPTFFGSIFHLEAEKYLLFATLKKDIMEKELNRDYEEMESERCLGVVYVENLVFHYNLHNKTEVNNDNQYCMCLVHSGATLFASDIVFPSKNGDIVFKKSFQFNNVTSDFEIYIKLYILKLDSSAHKQKPYLSPTKIYSTRKNQKANINHIEESSFQLLGVSKLVISDLYKTNTFTLQKILPNDETFHTFTADIHSSIRVNTNISGFLTIGTSSILWNRRWCVLEGSLLKYWNYPNDENMKEPIGTVNLSDSVNHQITSADKVICSRPRTMTLNVISEQGDLQQYFLQADNAFEFEEWKRQLNSVLISLNNWNCLRS